MTSPTTMSESPMAKELASGSRPQASDNIARFVDLVSQVRKLQQNGHAEEALELARAAEALATTLGEKPCVEAAAACNSLGVVFFQAAFTRSARALYSQALAIAEQLDPKNDELLSTLHNNLGQAAHRLADLAAAQAHLEKAIALGTKSGLDVRTRGIAVDNLGSVLAAQGELRRAEAMHREAIGMFERAGGTLDADVATALGNLSLIHRARHDFVPAEACRLRALDTHERLLGLAAPATVLDITSLADLYRAMGDESRADTFTNLLLSIGGGKPGRSLRFLAEMLQMLATQAFKDFRLDLAERLTARAVTLLETIEGPKTSETLAMLRMLGNVYRASNHREAAEQAYQRAREGYQALGDNDAAIAVTVDLGKLYRDAGAYPLARTLFRAALDHLRSQSLVDHQDVASVLNNLALTHYGAEEYSAADTAYAEALSEVQQDSRPYGERPLILHNRAMLRYHLGAYDEARDLYEEAKRLWVEERGRDAPFVAWATHNLALVHWARGDLSGALSAFAEGEALRNREMLRSLAVGNETRRAAYARELQTELYKVVSFCLAVRPSRPDIARFAAQMLLRRKGRVLDAVAHTLTQVRSRARPEDETVVARLQKVRTMIADSLAPVLMDRRFASDKHQLDELRREEGQLEAELSYRGALQQPALEEVTLELVQHSMPPGGVLLEFLRYTAFEPIRGGNRGAWKEERYAVAALCPTGEPRWADLGPVTEIDGRVDRWRGMLTNRAVLSAQRKATESELFRLLIAPLLDVIKGAKHLFVAPDGKLALIPFGLLRHAEDPPRHGPNIVSYLATGRDFLRVQEDEPGATGVVIVAAPDFEAQVASSGAPSAAERFAGRDGFAPLPGTKAEGEDLVRMLPRADLITGSDATVAALQRVQRPLVLHIATHGIFAPLEQADTDERMDMMTVGDELVAVHAARRRSANPMFYSGLALAGASRQGEGIITAQEIAGLDLRGTALVVLSACETGLGTVRRGEEFTGLRRALAIAGAACQVTSLWKVHDSATRMLMHHYYRLLLRGRGRAQALQLAQAKIARDPQHPEWAHPMFWGAFVSAGAWGPIEDRLEGRRQRLSHGRHP